MLTSQLNPPPVRPERVVNYNSWHREGGRICSPIRGARSTYSDVTITRDDFEEGGGDCYRRLFLESPKVEEPPQVEEGTQPLVKRAIAKDEKKSRHKKPWAQTSPSKKKKCKKKKYRH